jgi:hypothetical protein
LLDLTDDTNKPCTTAVTNKGYPGTACCKIGQNIPSDSCPSKIQTTAKIIMSVAGAVIVACLGVAFAFAWNKKRDKANVQISIPVAVPFEAGNNINRTASDDINNIMPNSSINASASVGRYPEASAPPASANPMLK